MNTRWNRFTQLLEQFNDDDIMDDLETELMIFRVFQQTLRNLPGRSQGKKPSIEEIESDSESEISQFLFTFLIDIDLEDQYGMMAGVCGFLLENLSISEEDDDFLGVRTYYAEALCQTGRAGEALAFCDQWRKEYPENRPAAAGYIRACIFNGKLEEGRVCAREWLSDDDECTEDNEVIFRAAQRLMDVLGEEKKAISMLHSIEDYEDEEDMSVYDDDFDDDVFDEDDEEEDEGGEESDGKNVFRFPSGPNLF